MIIRHPFVEPVNDFFYHKYNESHRFYHKMSHIRDMFAIAFYQNMKLSDEQIAAILFHDIYYDIPCKNDDNEERSGEYAYCIMGNYHNFTEDQCNLTKNIILDTKTHEPIYGAPESEAVIDLDLWFLFDIKEYKKNLLLIRKEYIIYDWEVFSPNRKYWLEKMLIRDTIYVSEYSNKEMNMLARKNIEAELDVIENNDDWLYFCHTPKR